MSGNNPIMEGLNEEFVDRIRSKYDDRFQTIAQYVPNFNDEKALKLGILLENTDARLSRFGRLFESTQTNNVLDTVKKQYFDIISATYPNLIAEELFSVQPLRYKSGEIFYLNTVYGSNKGKVRKGDTVFSNITIAGYDKANYSSEIIDQENIGAGNGTLTTFEGNLSYVPVVPGTVTITAGSVVAKDDGSNSISGTGIAAGSTINYDTGAFKIVFSTAPTDDIDAAYEFANEYAPVAVPEVDVEVKSYLVSARSKKLRGRYSLDAAYDLKQAQGVDLADVLKTNSAQLLKHETDGMLIYDAYQQAQSTITFKDDFRSAASGINKIEFYLEFIDTIVKAAGKIRQLSKRVSGNWVVCGNDAINILNFIGAPRFIKAENYNAVGPHFAGMLDGRYRIYDDPFLGEDEFLVGYKGDNLLDAGLVYAPYLPFYCTDAVVLDDFLGRQGFSTSYGKKMVNSNYYVRGKITKG